MFFRAIWGVTKTSFGQKATGICRYIANLLNIVCEPFDHNHESGLLLLCPLSVWSTRLRANDFPLDLVISGHILLQTWTSRSKTFWHSLSSMWVFWYFFSFFACAIFCQAPEKRNKLKMNGRALSSSRGKNRWERKRNKAREVHGGVVGLGWLAACLGLRTPLFPAGLWLRSSVIFSS